MRKAHAALLASLNNPQISADLVFAQVDSFLEQASNLKTGLENSAPKK